MPEKNLGLDLQDYADFDKLKKGYADWSTDLRYNRRSAVEEVLPDSAGVYYEREGGYHGLYTIVVEYDGLTWVSLGSYGSCSGCDGFYSAKRSDEENGGTQHLEERVRMILRDAYAFKTVNEAEKYIGYKNSEDTWRCDQYPTVKETLESQ